jgi:hypothetical protein
MCVEENHSYVMVNVKTKLKLKVLHSASAEFMLILIHPLNAKRGLVKMKHYIGGFKRDQNGNQKCTECGKTFTCNLCNGRNKPFKNTCRCPDCSGNSYPSCWVNTPGYEEWKKKWNIE